MNTYNTKGQSLVDTRHYYKLKYFNSTQIVKSSKSPLTYLLHWNEFSVCFNNFPSLKQLLEVIYNVNSQATKT